MKTYITLLTTDNYLSTVLSFVKQLNQYTKLPILVICSKDLQESTYKILEAFNINYQILDIQIPYSQEVYNNNIKQGHAHWNGNWLKLGLWTLIEYDQICYIDADILIQYSFDNIFDTYTAEFNALRDFNKDWIAPTMLVFKPSLEMFNKLCTYLQEHSDYCLNEAYVINGLLRDSWNNDSFTHIDLKYCTDISYTRRISGAVKLLSSAATVHFLGAKKPNMMSNEELEQYYWINEIEYAKKYKQLIKEIEQLI